MLENWFQRKKQKLNQLLWHRLFNQWVLTDRPKLLTNACSEKLCLSDSSCSGDSVSESKPEASQVTTC